MVHKYLSYAWSVFGGRQTPTMHMINILCDPKQVGVIFNYVSFTLL